jgi:hypothetical protein
MTNFTKEETLGAIKWFLLDLTREQFAEFNDKETRSKFVEVTNEFLERMKFHEMIENYIVICDETNNTEPQIDANEFRSSTYLKFSNDPEFTCLNTVYARTGIELEHIKGMMP